MATTTLYGIKNCDTVKKARQWLEQHGKAYRFHDVRHDGLTQAQLHDFAARSDWNLLLNRSSASWRQLPPEQKTHVTPAHALALILQNPTLLKRPVLDTGDKLIIGFSADRYQTEL
jgi:Spx/MgsR family transcriptional regulator